MFHFTKPFKFFRSGLIRVAAIGFIACSAFSAQATSYQDIWWNANESGWGLNITQQGDIIFATWYVQGTDGAPTWFTAVARKSGNEVFNGAVSTARGPWYGAAWNPSAVSVATLGSATFTFTDKKTLNLQYTANSGVVTKTLTRFTYGAQRLAGDFYGSELGQPSNCSNNDRYYTTSLFRVSTAGNTMTIVQETQGSVGVTSCTLTGAFQQYGTNVEASGNYTCSTGASGTWRATDGLFGDEAFSLRVTAQNGTCRVDATYTGARN
jgi:hypothetical protein